MELEYSDKNSRRSKVYIARRPHRRPRSLAATVFVALQASGLTADSDVEMRSVVVAVRDIPARKAIEEGDVAVREVVADPTNETAFTSLDEVLGRVAGIPVATGQLVTRNVLASTTEGQTFSILDPGRRVRPERPRPARGQPHRGRRERGRPARSCRARWSTSSSRWPINPEVGQTEEGVAEQATDVVPGPSTKVTLQSMTILARERRRLHRPHRPRDRGEDRRAPRRRRHLHDGAPARGGRSHGRHRGIDDRRLDRGVRLPGSGAAGSHRRSRREAGTEASAERSVARARSTWRRVSSIGAEPSITTSAAATFSSCDDWLSSRARAVSSSMPRDSARRRDRIGLVAAHDPDLVAARRPAATRAA